MIAEEKEEDLQVRAMEQGKMTRYLSEAEVRSIVNNTWLYWDAWKCDGTGSKA